MYNRFYEKSELNDLGIINALKRATKDYENGEIAEVRDILEEIVIAIDEFELSL